MKKYENVDVITALGTVVENNTMHYKTDFKYDIEMFNEAAGNPDGENKHLYESQYLFRYALICDIMV